jgi:hypothetical protein
LVWDDEVPGLCVRVYGNGAKSFIFIYRLRKIALFAAATAVLVLIGVDAWLCIRTVTPAAPAGSTYNRLIIATSAKASPICNRLFRVSANLNQSTAKPMEWKTGKADQLARLMPFLLLGYFALSLASAFTFTW